MKFLTQWLEDAQDEFSHFISLNPGLIESERKAFVEQMVRTELEAVDRLASAIFLQLHASCQYGDDIAGITKLSYERAVFHRRVRSNLLTAVKLSKQEK